MTKRLAALAAAATTGLLIVAGCGDNDAGDTRGVGADPTTAAFNDADVAFAQGMIPHHQQAIEMAELAMERAASSEVRELAARIEAAQDPEIDTMSDWLRAWGEEVPEDLAGMDHGDMEMPGMMSDADMQALEQATDVGFDRLFLHMMIEHHQGAIEMARTERADGQDPAAITLAGQIESAQTAEIAEMRELLGG